MYDYFGVILARHVVEEKRDIKRAMEFLHECDLLNIEDILPFFPDFVTIDHFKVSRFLLLSYFLSLVLLHQYFNTFDKSHIKKLYNNFQIFYKCFTDTLFQISSKFYYL